MAVEVLTALFETYYLYYFLLSMYDEKVFEILRN